MCDEGALFLSDFHCAQNTICASLCYHAIKRRAQECSIGLLQRFGKRKFCVFVVMRPQAALDLCITLHQTLPER